jgi:hypothetical protein
MARKKRPPSVKVLPPSTIWEWFAPDLISTDQSFLTAPYGSNDDVSFDLLDLLQSSTYPECNFPVYPKVFLGGSPWVRTNIAAFTQYAGQEVPPQLVNDCRIISQKGRYIGCDNGTANISQLGVNFVAAGDYGTLTISSISDLGDGTVLVVFGVGARATNIFTKYTNPINQPFFPYNSQTTLVGGVPIFGETYLNKGKIQCKGLRAHYIPGNKNTQNNPNTLEWDFTIIA